MKLRNILMVMKDTCILTLDDFTYNMEMMSSQSKSYNWVGSAPLFWQQCAPMCYRHFQCPMNRKHVIHNTWVSPRGRLRTLGVYTPHLHMGFPPEAVNMLLGNPPHKPLQL